MVVLGIIVGLIIISIMMVLHEYGHFVAGRLLGFTIKSFNIFMGPTVFKRNKKGVDYTIKAFPIGASVEFAGELEEETETDEKNGEAIAKYDPNDPGLFFNRPRWARAIVAFAGPFMNFLSAFVAMVIMVTAFGITVPVVKGIQEGGTAQQLGIREGDRLLKYNHSNIHTMMDYQVTKMLKASPAELEVEVEHADGSREVLLFKPETHDRYRLGISYQEKDGKFTITTVDPKSDGGKPSLKKGDNLLSANGVPVEKQTQFAEELAKATGGKPIEVEVERDGAHFSFAVTPTLYHDVDSLDITFGKSRNFFTALKQGFYYQVSVVKATVMGLGSIFQGKMSAKEGLAGPVAIVGMIGGVVNEHIPFTDKLAQLLLFFTFISVAIGFTNLLPIPPLDGHHLMILGIEGIIRKDLPVKFKHALAMVGFVLIMILAVLVLYLDISRLFF